jgi:hypothetical protein
MWHNRCYCTLPYSTAQVRRHEQITGLYMWHNRCYCTLPYCTRSVGIVRLRTTATEFSFRRRYTRAEWSQLSSTETRGLLYKYPRLQGPLLRGSLYCRVPEGNNSLRIPKETFALIREALRAGREAGSLLWTHNLTPQSGIKWIQTA